VRLKSSQSGRRSWGVLSALAAGAGVASLVAHLCSFAGIALQDTFPPILVLHLLVFFLIVMVFLRLRWWQCQDGSLNLRWSEIIHEVPVWVRISVLLLSAYTLSVFVLMYIRLSDTAHENATSARIDAARTLSAHWLLLYAAATAFFVFVPPRPRKDSD
jgi:hypothetical protein